MLGDTVANGAVAYRANELTLKPMASLSVPFGMKKGEPMCWPLQGANDIAMINEICECLNAGLQLATYGALAHIVYGDSMQAEFLGNRMNDNLPADPLHSWVVLAATGCPAFPPYTNETLHPDLELTPRVINDGHDLVAWLQKASPRA